MKPLFSVIVPIFGVEDYIDKCIKSILEQDFDDYEIILVDDGSPDSCPQICDSYAKQNPKISVVHKENGGLVSARKAGLERSKGRYILNVDGDDYINPKLLSNLARIINDYHPDVISFDYDFVDENGDIMDVHHDKLREGLMDKEFINCLLEYAIYDTRERDHNTGCISYNICFKAIKRTLLYQAQCKVPDQIRMGEDLAVGIPTLEIAQSLYISSFPGYAYRQRMNSMVRTFNFDEDKNIIKLVEYLFDNLTVVKRDNIYGYAVRMGLGQLIKAARQLDDYCIFKKYAEDFHSRAYEEWLKNYQHSNLFFKRKIRIWIIKKRFWRIFWMVYSR